MDIIIRNGVIDKSEAKRVHNIKNEEGLLKKNFADYIKGVPGPYYDTLNVHLCIPRHPSMIRNFYGPQDPSKIKLIENSGKVCSKCKYCVICHKLMKPNPAFSAKRKCFIEEDIYCKKSNESDSLEKSLSKLNIATTEVTPDNTNNTINDLNDTLKNLNIKTNFDKWNNLYNKILHSNVKSALKDKGKENRVVNRFSKLCTKLKVKPIDYEMSNFETKLIYPWNLTPYQKFKLNNPDYKNSPLFSHQRNKRITESFVTIE
jgi:hypothetical protein